MFAKNIHNYVYSSARFQDITSNGVTELVLIKSPANFNGTGKVRGFEVSYTQTYDFLPGLLSGFGLSANYAYVTSKGIPNSFLNGGAAVNTPPTGGPPTGSLPLAQLSKHTINIEPFYEKGPVSIRVAYNWRSKFLLTELDVIFPYDPIWQKAYGTLDASAFYTINPHLKIGVQAQNLTNAVTETLQQFTTTGLQGPRSDVMICRFSFILRGTFGGGLPPRRRRRRTTSASATANADVPRRIGDRGRYHLRGSAAAPGASASAASGRTGARVNAPQQMYSTSNPFAKAEGFFSAPVQAYPSTDRRVVSARLNRAAAKPWWSFRSARCSSRRRSGARPGRVGAVCPPRTAPRYDRPQPLPLRGDPTW